MTFEKKPTVNRW